MLDGIWVLFCPYNTDSKAVFVSDEEHKNGPGMPACVLFLFMRQSIDDASY